MDAYICTGTRTPIGSYGGALSKVRTDDLAAHPIKSLMAENPQVDWSQLDEVYFGCANQAGEDNRNVARMATLLSGLPETVAAITVNRLCASGMDAVIQAARAIKCGEADFTIAGGVESMSRSPMVMPKAEMAFSRKAEIFDTTIGWRFVNSKIAEQYGVDSMPETAENVVAEYNVSRTDQDAFALWSQQKAAAAQQQGILAEEISPVTIKTRKADIVIDTDEHPRADCSLASLAKLRTPFRDGGTVTAGNASGINDAAAALIIASKQSAEANGLTVTARIVAASSVGVSPRMMGVGPVPAIIKVLAKAQLTLDDMDVIEINEAFAGQVLACTRSLGLKDDDARLNPNGGGIALGHPLGMSGARIVLTAAKQLERTQGQYALCSLCVGVGQGVAILIERVKGSENNLN